MSAALYPLPLAVRPRVAINDPLRCRLEALAPGAADAIGLGHQRRPSRTIRARREILREGECPAATLAIQSGWAAFARHFPDGRRQIQHLLLPGDIVGLGPRVPLTSSLLALTPVTLVELDPPSTEPGAALDQAVRRYAALTLQQLLNAVCRVGRQSAQERFAHLLLELRDRLQLAGLGDGNRFEMPLTQEMLADTLGLTSVHVNRTLQAMRQQSLVTLREREVVLLDAAALARIADYQSPALA
ncbi:Crp/Fnr family transcriptional regulator [Sphingomonas adhaesiva]|uniref:Crp/Fnr family transcriptional regulator n=1 Tax=Sphingomonas adhaesiva TaxID=28212 RepID=UPI002FF6CD78